MPPIAPPVVRARTRPEALEANPEEAALPDQHDQGPRRSMRAAIFGFQGLGNLGDEMILAGIERLLDPLPIRVTTLFGGPILAQTPAYRGARRHTTWRLMPTPRALREFGRNDLFIIGGGGLINDHWAGLIPRMLLWIAAARLRGARVVWLGVGVGPIRRRAWRPLARLAARLSTTVLVRDEASARLVGGPSRTVGVIPDPALFLDPPPPRGATADRLGMIVRPPVDDREPHLTNLVEVLAALAAAGRASGLRPHLLMMAPVVDAAFAARVADHLARDGERPTVDALPTSPEAALRFIADFPAVVSVRLHGVFLSAIAGVPCVPIGYDVKVGSAASRLGLDDLVVSPTGVDPDAAARALAAARHPERVRAVAERMAAMRGQADRVRDLLLR